MFDEIQKILEKLNANHREYRTWQKVVSVLACITVFCTTYALILPAITLESSPDVICGMEEHTHTSDCYERTPVLVCENTDPEHVHTDECYRVDSVIICGKQEHKHTEACFPKEEEADLAEAPTTEPTEGTDGDGQSETKQPETSAAVTSETGETKGTEETKAAEETENDEESTEAEETNAEEQPEQKIPATRSMLRAAALKNVKKTRTINADGVETEKNISDPDANGVYTITMEAYATGSEDITIVEKTAPTDIILVLDQSGSMGDNMSGGSFISVTATASTRNSSLYQSYSSGKFYGKTKTTGGFVEILISSANSNYTYSYYLNGEHNSVTVNGFRSNFPAAQLGTVFDGYYRFQASATSNQRLASLQAAAKSFVNEVVKSANGEDEAPNTGDEVKHRIAVVGFADGGADNLIANNSPGAYHNTEVIINSSQYQYADEASGVYGSAFVEMDQENAQTSVENSIDALSALGATNTDLGLQMANNIFSANSTSQRNRVVVLFTDGVPGKGETWRKVSCQVADRAISQANTLKQTYKATVYTIGIFDGADPTKKGSDWTADWANATDTDKLQTAVGSAYYANYFMHQVSSNKGTSNDGYYLVASNADGLNAIFKRIAQAVSSGGPTNYSLSSLTTVKDIVSDFFDLPEGANASSVKVYAVPCTGEDASGKRTFKDSEDGFNIENYRYDGATVNIDGKNVSVSGFDFSTNWCGVTTEEQEDGTTKTTPHGYKLVIKFPVEAEDNFIGGYDVPSNDSQSGIYVKNTLLEDFPVPTTDVVKNIDELLPDTLFSANDKTIYAKGTTLTADDLFNGLDKVRTLKAFVESSHAQTETNTEYTFDIPDDDAIKNDASGQYTVKVEVKRKSTGEIKTSKSATAHVYVLVPQVEWRDNRVLCSEAYTKQDCLDHNFVSVDWVADNGWKYTTDGGNAPAATGSAGTLSYTFVNNVGTPYDDEHPIVVNTDTPVNVWVFARYGDGEAVNITDSTIFTYEACNDPLHTQTSIHSHKGSEGSPEFYLHADSGAVLPSTGGSGTKNWLIVGLTFMALPIMIGLSIQRRRDMILVV